MTKSAEIAAEQHHFDEAWKERERKRTTLKGAHHAAGGPIKDAARVRQAANKELGRLGGPDDPVAFGRFDQDGQRVYIGNHLISTDDRDILVINWQARAAEAFYRATVQHPLGVSLKRTFATQRNRVTDFDDVILQELSERIEALTGPQQWGVDDAVLKDLETSRTGEMRDIVQTIHAAQYELIRTPLDRLLLIQGGPGTGKTAVALHRVSWLLFNNADELGPGDCLVVGPNPTFTRYIKAVLPGLGDADVAHRDLRTLGPQRSSGAAEANEVAGLKGRSRMAGLLERALWNRVRLPDRTESLPIGTSAGMPVFTREEVEGEIARLARSSTYNSSRSAMRQYLTSQSGRRAGRGGPPPASAIDSALERIWPSLTPQAFLRELLGSRDRLLAAAGEDFTAADVGRLQRAPADKLSDEAWTDADVALLDEAEFLINGTGETYGHIVLDEAQDLSEMQLRSIRRRSRNGSMTVVGDIAQSTGHAARDSWEEVAAGLVRECESATAELSLGYRVPRQIFEFAAELLPYAAPTVTAPRVVRDGPSDPELMEVTTSTLPEAAVASAREHAGNGRFVGLICPDAMRHEVIDEFRRLDVTWSDVSNGELGKAINLARPAESKGLEFDAVVVVDPTGIVREAERGFRMLYVALTRTTKYLTVVHDGVAMPTPRGSGGELSERLSPAVVTVAEPPAPEVDVAAPGHVTEVDSSPRVRPRPARPVATGRPKGLAGVLVAAASASVAEQVRDTIAPAQWPQFLDQLRRELGVSQDDVFDLFD